jgi:hypothetical protein
VSIYPGTRIEREYAAGFDDGRIWADADAHAHEPAAFWVETFQAEVRWAHTLGLRAYYLGVLRGYRSRVRTPNARGEYGI